MSGLARSTFYYYLKSKDTDKYKEMLDGLFKKLPSDVRHLFYSD